MGRVVSLLGDNTLIGSLLMHTSRNARCTGANNLSRNEDVHRDWYIMVAMVDWSYVQRRVCPYTIFLRKDESTTSDNS